MSKACSSCGSMSHNSRTCITYNKSTLVGPGFKLFGVQLDVPVATSLSAMKESCSVGCFSPSSSLSSCALSDASLPRYPSKLSTEYLSNHLNGHPQNRKKGALWTEDEHRNFLAGLEKLGKGDWRGISKHFVPSRTPTQIASHAQKYFLRQNNLNRKRKGPRLYHSQTETGIKVIPDDPRNLHDCMADISRTAWRKYANCLYSEAFCGRSNYLQSPMMSNLLLANWLYNSSGLSIFPKCEYLSKPVIDAAEPNLDLTLAAPPQSESTCGCLGPGRANVVGQGVYM